MYSKNILSSIETISFSQKNKEHQGSSKSSCQDEDKSLQSSQEISENDNKNFNRISKQKSKKIQKRDKLTNSQKSYSVFEDSLILKTFVEIKNARNKSFFKNLRDLTIPLGRTLSAIQNRSRILRNLSQSDMEFIKKFAENNEKLSKNKFISIKKKNDKNQDCPFYSFDKEELESKNDRHEDKFDLKEEQDETEMFCDKLRNLLQTGKILEDEFFNDQTYSPKKFKNGQMDNGSSRQNLNQSCLNENLSFLKSLIAFLIENKRMSVENLMILADSIGIDSHKIKELVNNSDNL